jgi:prepilin-type N-terminal cleavage/methylation domain-containing protein
MDQTNKLRIATVKRSDSKERRGRLGFSLVELMVVVAIISILTAIAVPRYITNRVRVERVEAKANMRVIGDLLVSFHAENERLPDLREMPDYFMDLTTNDRSTATSCHTDNFLGFKPADCRKERFAYILWRWPNLGFNQMIVVATSYPNICSPDVDVMVYCPFNRRSGFWQDLIGSGPCKMKVTDPVAFLMACSP